MQSKQTLTKEELQAWKAQLQVTHITEQNLEEALTLVVDSTVQLSTVFKELEISRETCFEIFRPDFEDKLNQKNSILIVDPSADNKIIGVRVFRDMVHVDQTAPKKENFQCEKLFLKSQLNHELMEGIYEKKYEEKDYEICPMFNVHPEYANRGLSEYMIQLYVEHAYRRGVKNFVNIVYNKIVLKILTRIKPSNPVILKEISMEDREIDGKKVFNEQKNGYLLTQELNDETVSVLGLSKLVELKKQDKLNFDEKQFYNQ